MVIKWNNELYSIFKMEHRTPGNLRGFVQVKMRRLSSGTMIEHRFSSEDKVERAVLDQQDMEYLYDDGDYFYFMNTETFEQMHLTRDFLGDATNFLIPNLKVEIEFYEGKPMGIELPATVELKVVRDRARPEGRDGIERHQARHHRNRPGGARSAVHQRRRKNQGLHRRIGLSRTRVVFTQRQRCPRASARFHIRAAAVP